MFGSKMRILRKKFLILTNLNIYQSWVITFLSLMKMIFVENVARKILLISKDQGSSA